MSFPVTCSPPPPPAPSMPTPTNPLVDEYAALLGLIEGHPEVLLTKVASENDRLAGRVIVSASLHASAVASPIAADTPSALALCDTAGDKVPHLTRQGSRRLLGLYSVASKLFLFPTCRLTLPPRPSPPSPGGVERPLSALVPLLPPWPTPAPDHGRALVRALGPRDQRRPLSARQHFIPPLSRKVRRAVARALPRAGKAA